LLMSKQNPIRAHTATNFRYFSDRLLARSSAVVRDKKPHPADASLTLSGFAVAFTGVMMALR
jgi:hypothetical protein